MKRVESVSELRSQGQSAGVRIGRIAPRDVYKEIAWTTQEPGSLRAAVIDALLNDPDPAIVEDAKQMAKLLLPKEGSREVVVTVCKNAGTKGWTDFTPAIVRAYSQNVGDVEEVNRVEAVALRDLHPGKPIEEVVFDVFMNPPKVDKTEAIDWTMRYRSDAWEVLSRLDPTGANRQRMVANVASADQDPVLQAVRASGKDLRCIPINGEELNWLAELRDPKQKENGLWWRQTTAGVAQVSAQLAPALRLRHMEPIRWASLNRPSLLSMTREQLLAELTGRLAGRKTYQRTATEGKAQATTQGPRKSELLERRADELSWGDILAIIVIDEAIHQPQVVSALFSQAQADQEDKSTEYGGLLAWKQSGSDKEYSVVMIYMPRSAQRISDLRFIASDDMITAGDLSLAHYHFHVQKEKNAEYAGPSKGDLEYADRFGRSCLVLTSVSRGVMAVDYYQSGDVVIDLGGLVNQAAE